MHKIIIVMILLLAFSAFAQRQHPRVIDSGGGQRETDTGRTHVSIGQPIIGKSTDGENIIHAGFINANIRFTAIEDDPFYDKNPNLPKTIELSQPYPNPFNSTCKFSVSMQEPMKVSLAVYDLQGRLYGSTVEDFGQGQHSLMVDMSEVESGVYLYRLKAVEFEQTGKMILLK